ncbi:MAG: rRNA maturation RNase YbeY [Candidatus Omnitrophota bacterium]
MAKVIIKNLQTKLAVSPTKIKRTVLKALSARGAKRAGEITVCFVNDKEIRRINAKYLKENKPTDVIAFNLGETADIVVSTDTAIRQAKIFKTSAIYELYLYVVHGVLHISGYDDKTLKERNSMNAKAALILKSLNVYP